MIKKENLRRDPFPTIKGGTINSENLFGNALSSAKLINPNPCYQVGDVGPAGGIIFFHNSTNDEYYEVGIDDLSDVTEPTFFSNYSGIPCSLHEGGAEWGLMNVPLSTIGQSFGDGQSNTDIIYNLGQSTYHSNLSINPGGDSACLISPCHPTNDTRTIAADLCKEYTGGGLTDWFLPSMAELLLCMWNVGATQTPLNNIAGFTTNPPGTPNVTNLHPSYYWTSSIPGGNYTAIAMSSTVFSSSPSNTLRCSTWLVRPVRKFICTAPSCSGCPCIEYNYRDSVWCWGACLPPGQACQAGGMVGSMGQGSNYMPGSTSPYAVSDLWPPGTPFYNLSDSVIGNEMCFMKIGSKDVMGNDWNLIDWADDSIGYTISVWDRWYNFLGKWHYDNYDGGNGCYQSSHLVSHSLLPDVIALQLSGVTHLEGPGPIVHYDRNPAWYGIGPVGAPLGSNTKAFFKIEAACNTNLPTAFEDGCNHTFCANCFPAACVSGTVPPCPSGVPFPLMGGCIKTFGTYPIPYTLYAGWQQCSGSCGGSSSSFTSGGGEILPQEEERFFKLHNIKTTFEDTPTPKIGNVKDELNKIRRKKR